VGLIAIAVLLRVVVSQSGRSSLTPAIAIVVAAILLLGVYFARDPQRLRDLVAPAAAPRGEGVTP
jgi:hypothetical protein